MATLSNYDMERFGLALDEPTGFYRNRDKTARYREVFINRAFPDHAQVMLENGLCTFVDKSGNEVPWSQTGYLDAMPAHTKVAVCMRNLYAISNGDDPVYTRSFFCYSAFLYFDRITHPGIMVARDERFRYKILRLDGSEVDGVWYGDYQDPSEGFIGVKKVSEALWGYVELSTGKHITGMDYCECKMFKNGMAIVTRHYPNKGNGEGAIDTTGREVIPCEHSIIRDFDERGLAEAMSKNHKWGVIDATGKWVIPDLYMKLHLSWIVDHAIASTASMNRYQVINLDSNTAIIPPILHSPHNVEYPKDEGYMKIAYNMGGA